MDTSDGDVAMNDRLLLVIIIDALGARMLRDHDVFAGLLDARSSGVRSVLGYSSACIPSLLTGLPPVDHGHWAMYVRDPEHSVFRSLRPWIALASGLLRRDNLARRGIYRRLRQLDLSGYYSLYEVPPRLLPEFNLCQRRDLFSPEAFEGLETVFDAAARMDIPRRVWTWRGTEESRREELKDALRAGQARMLFSYSPLLDAVGHAHSTRSAPFDDCLRGFAEFVSECVALATRSYRETRLLVFGDHGMADTTAVHDLYTPLRAMHTRRPNDFLYFLDSTMGRFWFFNDAARKEVTLLLEAQSGGRTLSDEECGREGILFPDRRYGETIFLAHPGVILAPSFMGREAPRAMHGYHPDDEDSDTVLLANFPHAPVRSIMEIGPLMTAQLAWLTEGGALGTSVRAKAGGSAEAGNDAGASVSGEAGVRADTSVSAEAGTSAEAGGRAGNDAGAPGRTG